MKTLTAEDILALAASGRGVRLATLARSIPEIFPELVAWTEEGYSSTDRKIPGTRLVWPGKGRTGTVLVVAFADEPAAKLSINRRLQIYRHDLSETYRTTSEAVREVARWIRADHSVCHCLRYATLKCALCSAKARRERRGGA